MTPRVRCAIYTRKSSEEGLDQKFNSLDAQREACEAFVKSQRGLGWTALTTHYDDGGISGGTMDRPALQTLLNDIDDRRVDLVVVYKVDRLTRSLADFAKIVERFEAQGISFVSVTQQFNTSTSMGRLTLNVLLSFAQFEREVTGERIRDKIAASKKKGMWMGGQVPLGYDLNDRKLIINAGEAKIVCALFKLYLDRGSVNTLLAAANLRGYATKKRKTSAGKETGGHPFTRGHLYQLLSNPLYVGEVTHKGQTYAGQHKGIVDRKVFDRVQGMLDENTSARRSSTNTSSSKLLTGLIFDETGERLCPTFTVKKGHRYSYYISKRLMHGTDSQGDGWRLPAAELEKVVLQGLAGFLRDEQRLMRAIDLQDVRPHMLRQALAKAADVANNLGDRSKLEILVSKVVIHANEIAIEIRRSGLTRLMEIYRESPNQDEAIVVKCPVSMRRRGVEAKLIIGNTNCQPGYPDPTLIGMIAKAHLWWNDLITGGAASINEIAARENCDAGDITRTLQLAFLSPTIVQTIVAGCQPVSLTAYSLKRMSSLPLDWREQSQKLGLNA